MIGRRDFEKSPIEQHINTKLSELNVRFVENSRACQCEIYPPAVTPTTPTQITGFNYMTS